MTPYFERGALGGVGAACGTRCFCACHQEPAPIRLEDFGLSAAWFPLAWQQRTVLQALLPPGTSISRERLVTAVYGPGAGWSHLRALRVTVHRLRRTLQMHGWALHSVTRHGYRLERVGG